MLDVKSPNFLSFHVIYEYFLFNNLSISYHRLIVSELKLNTKTDNEYREGRSCVFCFFLVSFLCLSRT